MNKTARGFFSETLGIFNPEMSGSVNSGMLGNNVKVDPEMLLRLSVPKSLAERNDAIAEGEAIDLLEIGAADLKLKMRCLDSISGEEKLSQFAQYFDTDDLDAARLQYEAIDDIKKIPELKKSDIAEANSASIGTAAASIGAVAAAVLFNDSNLKSIPDFLSSDVPDNFSQPLFTKEDVQNADDEKRRELVNLAKQWNNKFSADKAHWKLRIEKLEQMLNCAKFEA